MKLSQVVEQLQLIWTLHQNITVKPIKMVNDELIVTKLKTHQKEAVRFGQNALSKNQGLLIADDMGL